MTVMVIGNSSTLSAGKHGSRTAVRGIAGHVGRVRIGESGIVGGATSVHMGLAYPVRDVEVSHIHMIQGRGTRCEKPPFMVSLSSFMFEEPSTSTSIISNLGGSSRCSSYIARTCEPLITVSFINFLVSNVLLNATVGICKVRALPIKPLVAPFT